MTCLNLACPYLRARIAQNLTLQTLVTILNSTKSTDIPNVVKALPPDAQDTLMKYLYKGMALPGWGDVSGSVLLGWHEKVRVPSLHFLRSPLDSALEVRDADDGLWRDS